MREIDTIIGSRTNTAVRFNNLFVPANSVAHHINSFSEPAIFHSGVDDCYNISKSGSLTKLKYKDRYFALTTDHQVRTQFYDFNQLCIYNYDSKTLTSSNSVVFPNGNSDLNDEFDCLLFEFTAPIRANSLPITGWYDVNGDLSLGYTPMPIIVCCVGYPGYRNSIDYDAGVYGAGSNAIWGKAVEPAINGRLSFKPISKINFDPAGMSGGPVFGISNNDDCLVANFSGILTNASKSCFNFISLHRIKALFNIAFR